MSSPYSPYPQDGDQGGGYGQPPYQPYPGGSGWEPGTQQGYLQGGPVNFGQAVREAFRNIFTYNGRASRSAHWWFFLFYFIIGTAVRYLEETGSAGLAIGSIIGIVMILTWLSLAARRLHDANHSAFWLFLILFIFVGWIWLLVYYLQPGTPGPNRFG
ncbi:MAG TPA: DUF805 domain-containing protein [Trebonia sp.]|nr:DUF805 domain-containing protein [Trebonia sp.]